MNIDFALIHRDRSRNGHTKIPDQSLSKPEIIYNRLEDEDDDDDDSMVDAETGHEVNRRINSPDETSLMTLVGDVEGKVCFIVVSATTVLNNLFRSWILTIPCSPRKNLFLFTPG